MLYECQFMSALKMKLCAFEVLEELRDLFVLHIFCLVLFCNNHCMHLIKRFYSNQNVKCQVHFDTPQILHYL